MKISSLHLAASSLLLLQAADAAGIGPQRGFANDGFAPEIQHGSGNARLFPFLTKLRDGAIELIFGRHPSKSAERPAPPQVHTQYDNQLVLRFNVTTSIEERALSDAASRLFLDVWAFADKYVDIRLHNDEVIPLLSLLPRPLRTSHSTLIPDLAAAVRQSSPVPNTPPREGPSVGTPRLTLSPSAGDNLFFQDYQPLPVVVRWMRLLEAMFPSYVKFMTIGKSYEGRDIPALRVGVPVSDSGGAPPRKTIVIMGGSHAREWISTSTVNYLAWSFITSFGKERMITKLLDKFDIVFIPIANPDGVEYTWQVDRLWRKTRQQTNLQFCRGLDLDRAFGFEWDGSHVQRDPCSESYGGDKPFQATEAVQIADWARNETWNNVRFVGLVDLHSYSQQVLFPYSYSCSVDPPNLENLEELAAGIAKSIRLSNGEFYTVASACQGAVPVQGQDDAHSATRIESGGGSAVDWFYHEMRAHFSYQIKLRDTGSYGFLLPREHIVPVGEEIFDALKYYGDYLLGNNGIEWYPGSSNGQAADDNDDERLPDPETGNAAEEESPDVSELRKRRRLRR